MLFADFRTALIKVDTTLDELQELTCTQTKILVPR